MSRQQVSKLQSVALVMQNRHHNFAKKRVDNLDLDVSIPKRPHIVKLGYRLVFLIFL